MLKLRSFALCGAAAVIVSGATSGGAQAGPTPPDFHTTTLVTTPPYNAPCTPANMIGKVKFTTTLTNPDGVHFTAKAHALFEGQTSPDVTLDFSKHTTVEWTAEYKLPNGNAVHDMQVHAIITDFNNKSSDDLVGYMHIACGITNVTKPPPDPQPSPTAPDCTDYNPATLSLGFSAVAWSILKPGPFARSIYLAKLETDALLALNMFQHFGNVCLVGSVPDVITVWNTPANTNKPIAWAGTCETYDKTNMKLVNDATGWLVKAGDHVIGRYALEIDAISVAEVAKKRTHDCHHGHTTEPKEYRMHYLY